MTDVLQLPVISLWQPWAQWVALGWKTIETRTHARFASLVGRRIAIHAAKKWDPNWTVLANDYLTIEQLRQTLHESEEIKCGGTIVCTATVQQHRKLFVGDSQAAMIDCYHSFDGETIPIRYGLILSDVKQTTPPFTQIKGMQGIFYVPAALCR